MPANARALLKELEQLALRLADDIARANAAPPEERPRYLVFRAGGIRLRLPLWSISEVLLPLPLSRVPRAPDAVLGVMNLRGRVVPVVDLSQTLASALPESPHDLHRPADAVDDDEANRDVRFLLLDLSGREVGARVAMVERIESEAPEEQDQSESTADEPRIWDLDPQRLAEAIEALVT